MTAVEWLANELYEKFEMKGDGALFNDLVNQSKEMEMKQIIDAFNNGYYQETIGYNASEKYYNETFNK